MENTKYIIVNSGMFGGCPNAIIIDNRISHDMLNIPEDRIVSAGFFSWKTEKDDCGNPVIRSSVFGKSVSLGKESRLEDSVLIDRALNWWGNY